MKKIVWGYLVFKCAFMFAQEEIQVSKILPTHNQLMFNRFLVNPTFSLVRQKETYFSFYNRMQSTLFENNQQNYFLSYSTIFEGTRGIGFGVYGNWEGLISDFGLKANYAYGLKIGERNSLSFGANISYSSYGIDKNKAVVTDTDPFFNNLGKLNLISIEPGINLSLGRFDLGFYANNLFHYNLKTNKSQSKFTEKPFSGHLQYTHEINATHGIFKNSSLKSLVRGQSDFGRGFLFSGALLLEAPSFGWAQAGYSQLYGASVGLGLNLGKRLSIGYLMERNLLRKGNNLGNNYELFFAYTLKPGKVKDRESWTNILVESSKKEIDVFADSQESLKDEEIAKVVHENRLILEELILRQDSVETSRIKDLERRYERIIHQVKRELRDRKLLAVVDLEKETKQRKIVINNNNNKYRDKFNAVVPKDKSDHFIVVSVFKVKDNFIQFANKLKKKGLHVLCYKNVKTNLYYACLGNFDTRVAALQSYNSHLDGKFHDEKWIMSVKKTELKYLTSLEFED